MELSDQLPPSAQLDGFDISASQYPSEHWLPTNVSLSVHDAFTRFPEAAIGKYDVVHVALFITLIRNNDPGPLIKNLMALLSKQSPFNAHFYCNLLMYLKRTKSREATSSGTRWMPRQEE